MLKEIRTKNQSAYETHFPKVKVIYAEKNYWIIREEINNDDYLMNYLTRQPTLECIDAWFEGVVKGTCKPTIMCKED